MFKKLPIGIQSFKVIRTENYYYVDKTYFVQKLVDEGKYFFLSRPRRFGKSLFLDTLRQAFLGNKKLFKGLYLENNWDWNIKCPVIYISFGAGVIRSTKILLKTLESILREHATEENISLIEEIINKRFFELIKKLYEKYNRSVVVLIDEYDKPILDNLDRPEVAIEIREELKNFYSVLKDADEYLRFCFLTGVSKFAKVSIFSGLNNLKDITLHPGYATICGYTQRELETVFADRLKGVDMEGVIEWYNGYSWLGERVYNPFDVLLFLDTYQFRSYWFETGTPGFLIKLILKEKINLAILEHLEVGDELLESFDIGVMYPETILFQTGYLTIRDVRRRGLRTKYLLSYPNMEVKISFNNFLLNFFGSLSEKERNYDRIYDILEEGKPEELEGIFKSIFAGIPYDWFRKNDIEEYEGFYASVFYAYFCGLGVDVRVEDVTNYGRLDMAVLFGGRCYLFEFKVLDGGSEKAIRQIRDRRYWEKYRDRYKEIYLIGILFGKKNRNIVDFKVEKIA